MSSTEHESVEQLRAAVRIAEAVRGDACAHSQRLLDEKRELEAKLASVEQEYGVRDLAYAQLLKKQEGELVSLRVELSSVRSELASRFSEADRRTRNDRSALLRMAGNIASGLLAYPNDDPRLDEKAVARNALVLARAILAEVDGPEPRSVRDVETGNALAEAVREIELHNSDYQHRTSREVLERLERPLLVTLPKPPS